VSDVYYDKDGLTIYNADCLSVLHRLEGLDAVITDPPYCSGGAYRSDRTQNTVTKYVRNDTAAYRPEFGGDNRDQRSFFAWSSLWLSAAFNASRPGAVVACFIDWRQLPVLTDAIQAGGWTWRGVAVWSKKFGRPCAGRFSSACEFVVWGSKGPMAAGPCHPPGIFECSPVTTVEKHHIAQKPEPVMDWVLSIVPDGSTVCDPFMGSGTTLRAAKKCGCRCVGIESDGAYCKVARDRLAQGSLFQAEVVK